MRKGLVIVLAIAIIGALGVYGKNRSGSGSSDNAPAIQTQYTQPSVMSSDTSAEPASAGLKDGTYTGDNENTAYGSIQIAVVVSGGKISDVTFLRMPNDRGHTQEVTAFAEPLLKQETIGKQNAHIDFISGATQTSEGYQQSLQSALNQA